MKKSSGKYYMSAKIQIANAHSEQFSLVMDPDQIECDSVTYLQASERTIGPHPTVNERRQYPAVSSLTTKKKKKTLNYFMLNFSVTILHIINHIST